MSRQDPYSSTKKLKVLVRADKAGDEAAKQLQLEMDALRPRVRADCQAGGINEQRPCPWYGCRHHIGLDVSEDTGSLMVRDIDTMVQTCSLDVAEIGGVTLEEIGDIMDLTRERIRQVEIRSLLSMKSSAFRHGLQPEDYYRVFGLKKSSNVTAGNDSNSQNECEIDLADDGAQD